MILTPKTIFPNERPPTNVAFPILARSFTILYVKFVFPYVANFYLFKLSFRSPQWFVDKKERKDKMEKNSGFLRLNQVLDLIPVGKSTIYYLMQKGAFPKQVKLGPKLSVWRKTDIEAYISNGGSHD